MENIELISDENNYDIDCDFADDTSMIVTNEEKELSSFHIHEENDENSVDANNKNISQSSCKTRNKKILNAKQKMKQKKKKYGRTDYYKFNLEPERCIEYSHILDSAINKLKTIDACFDDGTNMNDIIKDIQFIRNRVKLIQDIGENFKKKDQMLYAFTQSVKKKLVVL